MTWPQPLLLSSSEAALATGVTQATLREWVHRGLLTNRGTRRRAFYDASELVAAMDAAKPRRASASEPVPAGEDRALVDVPTSAQEP